MLMPKRVKRRKRFHNYMAGKATRGNKITYGEYGLVAQDPAWIKSQPDRSSPCRYDSLYEAWR